MKFVPKKADHSINVSKEYQHPFKILISLFANLLIIFLCIYFALAGIVEIAIISIPDKLNTFIGEKIYNQAIDQKKFSDNKKSIQQLLDNLVLQSPYLAKRKFQIIILPTLEKNAFALPGDNISITQGLLQILESENELAMILSHELSHFINNDHLRALSHQIVLTSLTSLIGVGSGSGDLSVILTSSADLFELNYSKKQESAADIFGLHLLNKYYGHAAGAISALQKLEDPKTEKKVWFPLTSTHPLTQERITTVQNIITNENMLELETIPFKFNKMDKNNPSKNE